MQHRTCYFPQTLRLLVCRRLQQILATLAQKVGRNQSCSGTKAPIHGVRRQGLIASTFPLLLCFGHQFPTTKFVQSISTSCIPNYPDKNLPSIFVYNNVSGESTSLPRQLVAHHLFYFATPCLASPQDDLKKQIVGPSIFGGESMTAEGTLACGEMRFWYACAPSRK